MSPRNSCRLTSGCFWWLRNIQPSHTSVAMGAFAGGGGILRQARPDSRREILLVAAFYGRARKATAQFYPAMATHFEGVWPNAPILNEAERTPKSLCRFIRRSEEHPLDIQSLMRISYAVFCLKKKNIKNAL